MCPTFPHGQPLRPSLRMGQEACSPSSPHYPNGPPCLLQGAGLCLIVLGFCSGSSGHRGLRCPRLRRISPRGLWLAPLLVPVGFRHVLLLVSFQTPWRKELEQQGSPDSRCLPLLCALPCSPSPGPH